MNGIDIAIAGILVIFAIRGFYKGFLLGLASLAGLIWVFMPRTTFLIIPVKCLKGMFPSPRIISN